MKDSTVTYQNGEGKKQTGVVLDTVLDNGNTRYLVEDSKGNLAIVAPAELTLVETAKSAKQAKEDK